MSVKNKTNKNNKRSQKGRSMVEMLGVLAIIGVLSVGGVYGYGVAMKKHKANEALHKASLMATTISSYAMSNNGNLPTPNSDFANFGYETALTDKGTQFDLMVKGIGFDVCTQMKNAKGGMVREVVCDEATGNATITYYKNLATNEAEGEKSPTGGSSNSFNPNGPTGDEDGAVCSGTRPGDCSVCLSTGESTAHWYDSDALCTTPGQTCVDGSCVTTAAETPTFTGNECKCIYNEDWGESICGSNDSYYCSTDADCKQFGTWDDTQEKCVVETCANNSDCTSDEYCHYSSVDSSTCKPDKKGTCVKKADTKGSFASGATAEADGFIRSSGKMDWFSAQNFCRSYGKNLVTLSQMGLDSAIPSGKGFCSGYTGSEACQNIDPTGWSAIQSKFGTDFYPWTANLDSSNSCSAFYVILDEGIAVVSNYYRNDYRYALCK